MLFPRTYVYRYAIAALIAWTILITALVLWEIRHERGSIEGLALNEARVHISRDSSLRQWAASHGGVYVPVDENTHPNPNLAALPERDLTTPSGKKLTLMTPSSMLRRVMEQYAGTHGVKGRIVGLNPIGPENAPDAWELAALRGFMAGKEEVSALAEIDGSPHLRLMQPCTALSECLGCHQGYRKGDILGGIGVALPLEPYYSVMRENSIRHAVAHSLVWALGVLAIGIGTLYARRDFRRREAVEEALQISAARNRAILSAIPDTMFQARRDGTLMDLVPSARTAPPPTPDALGGRTIRDLMPPEAAGVAIAHIERACDYWEAQSFEYETNEGGDARHFEARIAAAGADEVFGIVRDVTGRTRAERALVRANDILGAISDAQGRFIEDTPAAVLFDGLLSSLLKLTESEYGFIGEVLHAPGGAPYLKIHALANPALTNPASDDRARRSHAERSAAGLEFRDLNTLFGAVLSTGAPVISNDAASDPRRGGLPEGHPPINAFMGIPFYLGNTLVGVAGVANRPGGYSPEAVRLLAPLSRTMATIIEGVRSVEARARAERETLESRRFLQAVIDGVADPIMVIGADRRVMLMNAAASKVAGSYADDDSLFCFRVSHHSDAPCQGGEHPCPLEMVRGSGAPATVLHEHFGEKGEKLFFEIVASPYLAPNGEFLGIIEAGRDVTERVFAERALKESEEKFRSLAEHSPNMIFINRGGKVVYVNDKCAEIMGYEVREFLGPEFDFMTLVVPEARETVALNFSRHMKGEDVPPCEYRLLTRDGRTLDVIITTRLIRYDGRPAILGVVTDITDRKRMENDLVRSLAEKEMLIREVYHRVKNNLLAVSSLLKLQSAQIADPSVRGIFIDTQNRVKAMSMVHERLYRSGDLKTINFPEYLRSIAVQLFRTYEITEAKVRLRIDVAAPAAPAAPGIDLDIETMIPCGLILNELITNSLKHAFPGGLRGELAVSMHPSGEGYVLSVRDTGVGLPEGFDLERATSLGLRLVHSLAKQIGGELSILRDGGTEFRISFTPKKHGPNTAHAQNEQPGA